MDFIIIYFKIGMRLIQWFYVSFSVLQYHSYKALILPLLLFLRYNTNNITSNLKIKFINLEVVLIYDNARIRI